MLTPGQTSDLKGFDGFAEKIASDVVIADKGYDADKRVRAKLAQADKTAVLPPRRKRKTPASYDKAWYTKRHHIENFFSRLKDYRGIATRYDKRAICFLTGVYLAATIIWLD